MKYLYVAGLALVLSGTAACAGQHTGTGTNGSGTNGSGTDGSGAPVASAGLLPHITIRRTGGFAGVDDDLAVDARGAWTLTDRAGNRKTGQLTADQVAAIRVLATDPRLAVEAHHSPVATRCGDAFTYTVTVDASRISYTDCPSDPGQPTATIALVKRVRQSTS